MPGNVLVPYCKDNRLTMTGQAAGRLLTGPTATFTEFLIGPVPLLAAAVWS
jgi:hypothetical protein